jgi:glycosyltransferase involved in cell wall biosynthesis
LVTSNAPHPFFKGRLQKAESITLEKYLGPLKCPSFLRKYTRARALKQNDPSHCILWNRMDSYNWPGTLIYYEHGASWIAKKSQKNKDFFKLPHKIIANSHAAKRVLELKWDISSPITVIENPLKPTLCARTTPKQPHSTLRLGYIGRLIPLKGVSLILHALKGCKEVSLTIAGDGPEKERLIQEAKSLNVDVTFQGIIKDVTTFYDSIDILIVPSIREPLGLVAQEAALRGLPVIAANVDGLPEVVQHNKTGFLITPTLEISGNQANLPDLIYDPTQDRLVAPKLVDPTHIAEAITRLQESPALYSTFSQNALQLALKRPTFPQYAQNLLSQLIS